MLTYETFTAAGPAFVGGDGLHQSSSGQAAIACLFAHPGRAGYGDPCGLLTLAGAREQRVSAQPTIVVDVGVGSAPR